MKSRTAFFQQTRAVIAWVLTGALAVLGCSGFATVTPQGLHCPTAVVQEVTEVTNAKTCCGKIVPVVTKRAPREGEAGFKQCQCAEKKAAEKDDQAKTSEARVVPTMLAAPALTHSLGFVIWPGAPAHRFIGCGALEAVVFSPPTPPPQFI